MGGIRKTTGFGSPEWYLGLGLELLVDGAEHLATRTRGTDGYRIEALLLGDSEYPFGYVALLLDAHMRVHFYTRMGEKLC